MIQKRVYILIILLSILGLSILSPSIVTGVLATANGTKSTSTTCTGLAYDYFCAYTTGLTLGVGDTISWSFSGTNTYVGVQVWAIDNSNYALFSYNYGGTGYQLSDGSYYSASGTWNVAYSDTNWHIVFWNLDSDSLNYGYTTTLTLTVTGHDKTAPTLSITTPLSGATVHGTITISASSSDANGVSYTQVKIDSNSYVTDTTSPYSWTWDTTAVTDGTHTIYVQSYDASGNYITKSETVTVDNTGPSVSITAPSNGATVTGTIPITATATDTSGVSYTEIKIDSYSWVTDSTSPYSWTWDSTAVTDGAHTIYLQGVDTLGNTKMVSIGVTVDNTGPTLTITSPSNGQTYGGTITISASASDPSGVSYVEYNIDGGSWTSDSSSPYSWSFDTHTISDGTHTINFKAVDTVGNSKTASISITVNNQVQTTTPQTTTTNPNPTTTNNNPTTTTNNNPTTTNNPNSTTSNQPPATSGGSSSSTGIINNIKSSPGFEMTVLLAMVMSIAFLRRKMRKV